MSIYPKNICCTTRLEEEEIDDLKQNIRAILTSNSKIINNLETSKSNNFQIIGTAGTVTTLAAMDLKLREYDIDKVNKHILSYNYLIKLFNYMVTIDSNERIELPGLEQGREIVIIPGTAIVLIIMELLRCSGTLCERCRTSGRNTSRKSRVIYLTWIIV